MTSHNETIDALIASCPDGQDSCLAWAIVDGRMTNLRVSDLRAVREEIRGLRRQVAELLPYARVGAAAEMGARIEAGEFGEVAW